MLETQKITAHLPKGLLKKARKATGAGITETLREGLELLARQQAYKNLLALQGKLDLGIDLKALREDREF